MTKSVPGDLAYRATLDRQFNKRFVAAPDYVQRVHTTGDVLRAVQDAMDHQLRLVVTSGGHCLEGFVTDSGARAIVDMSEMKGVAFDRERRAFAVEAGASVGDAFRALAEHWGVVVPFGEYPGIGIGGHVCGGAFGFLCRELGLAADYLYAVEVVTVDESGRAHVVTATREHDDPNRELWWAHTGGGGGNFGIVTRYWFRSYGDAGEDPAKLLPRAPGQITTFVASWNWSDFDESSFARLLENHGEWGEAHSEPSSEDLDFWTVLIAHRRQLGKIVLRGLTTTAAKADDRVSKHVALIARGLPQPAVETASMPWLDFALDPFPDLFAGPPGGVRVKVKDALIRTRLDERQVAIAYEYLTRDEGVLGGMLGFATYGGRVNAISPDATASAHRDAIFDMACTTGWLDAAEDAENLRWVRDFYRELFAETGGAPVPGERYAGALINHPDIDLSNGELNASGVPWHSLYYRDNYSRLQRAKGRWDPRDVFHHAMSIRA
jgi:aclacinomycin oxidase